MKANGLDAEITALRKTLAWMDLVLANLSEGIVIVDSRWKVNFANEALADLIGDTRIFLLGKHIWDVLPLTQKKQAPKGSH